MSEPLEGPFQEEPEFRAHFVVEDPRYPLLCINGKFTYGLWMDSATGQLGPERVCICGAHSDNECTCDL